MRDMYENAVRIACIMVQFLALTFIFVRAIRLVRRVPRAMPAVLFAFAIMTFLVSDLYWLAFILMKQGTRLPFTPSEIADDGVLLLYGSGMISMYRDRPERTTGLAIASAIFAIANIALWIGWSGEWVKDIIGCFPFGYMVYGCVRALKLSGAFSRREWTLIGVGCAVLLTVQAAIFFCPDSLARGLDAFCYVVLFAGIAWFVYKLARAWRHSGAEICTVIAFSTICWCMCALYMSADPIWFIIDLVTTVMLFPALLALEKQMAQRQVTVP